MDDLELLRVYIDDSDPNNEAIEDEVLEQLISKYSSDLAACAVEAWTIKAATVANWYDVVLDNDGMSRSQVFNHCIKMAEHWADHGGAAALSGTSIESVLMTVSGLAVRSTLDEEAEFS